MKTFLKVISTAFAAIMLLVLSTLAVLLLASDETRKEWLIAAAGYATDREVVIDGEFDLDFGSTLVLHAAEVRVANTEWGVHPVLFRAQRLDASISLWPLLRGVLDFSLSLSEPELMLETSEGGAGNWDLAETAEESIQLGLPLTIAPREIVVTDGRFFYRKHGVEKQDEAEIKRLYLAVLENQRILELDGRFNELPLSLKSERSVGNEAETGSATQLSVNGQFGRLNIRADGTMAGSVEPGDPELDLAIAFESPSLRIVSGQLGQMLPDLGPLKGEARLHGPMSAPALKEIAAYLDSDKGKLKVSGTIGNVVNLSGFDMKLDAETTNLVELLKVFAVDLPLVLPPKAQAEARLSGDWPALVLADIKGKVTDGVSNAVVTGQISDLLDLDGVDLRGNINAPTLVDLPIPRHFHNNRLPKIGPVTGSVRITANDGLWSASETRIDVENGNSWIRFRAEIADLVRWRGLDSELQAKLRSLENLQPELPPGAAEMGPLEFNGVLKHEPADSGNLVFRGEATSEKLRLVATGSIGELLAEEQIAFSFELAADQLSDIGKLVGRVLPEVGPVQCKGRLVYKGNVIRLEQIDARVGNSDLAGHFAFSLVDKPERTGDVLGGRLTSNTLDLSELLPEREAVEITVLQKQKMVEASVDSTIPPAKRVFPTDPLPLEQLRQFRTRIELDVGKVIARQLVLDELKTVFSLVGGVLAVRPFSAQIGGKSVELEMVLDASRSPAAFEFSAHGDDLDIMHARSTATKLGLEGGEASFHVGVRGEGDSTAAIMASLDGTVAFGIVDSRLIDVSINKVGISLLDQINPVKGKGDTNVLECSAVYFEIKDGVATTPRGMAVQFEEVTWLGNGQIDLATERIRISARPKNRKRLGIRPIQLAKLVLIGGTLAKPNVQIDPVGVVGASANYAAAISTGGLSLILVGLVEKSQANERVCLQIMEPQVETRTADPNMLKRATGILKPKPSVKESAPSSLLDADY